MTAEITQATEQATPAKEKFSDMLNKFLDDTPRFEGGVVKGTVLAIENDAALIDVGLKVEGRVPLKEFAAPGQAAEVKVGDEVEVYIERFETARGEASLSRERARREEAWEKLEQAYKDGERVTGVIFGRVKGGFTVDLDGAVAFLPGSQVDIRPVRDIAPLVGTDQPFQILKMDRRRGNIVVSRRAVLEDTRAEQRNELIANLHEGQVLEGVVKNITDYGAFVDLGGVDGLLHVTDISWRRVNHPADALQIGQTVNVQVIRFNPETQRISLGMKQLEADPWEGVEAKYPVRTKFTGRVTNITDYGAFVELEPGVEGLVHVSEMSWTKKNVHPGKIISTSQEVEVMVLDVDPEKRRVSLGLKQCLDNPWIVFADSHPEGTVVEGEIKNITEFGLFVRVARRDLRHGASFRSGLADTWRGSPEEVPQGRRGEGQGADDRCREGADRPRPEAGRRRSLPGCGRPPRQDGDLYRHRSARPQRRGRDIRIAPRRHQALRSRPRPRRAAPLAFRAGRQGGCQAVADRPQQPPRLALHQGPGSSGREAGGGGVRLD